MEKQERWEGKQGKKEKATMRVTCGDGAAQRLGRKPVDSRTSRRQSKPMVNGQTTGGKAKEGPHRLNGGAPAVARE